MPSAKDAEEYYCLKQPDPDEGICSGSSDSGRATNPDVIPPEEAGSFQQQPQQPAGILRHPTHYTASVTCHTGGGGGDSGASVNSDYSASSCSASDRTPPYMPRNPANKGRVRKVA